MLDLFRRRVAALKPGQRLKIDRRELDRLNPDPGIFAFLDIAPPEDRILEGIVGSAWEWRHFTEIDDPEQAVTFERLKEPLDSSRGEWASISHDRRDLFERTARGTFRPKP